MEDMGFCHLVVVGEQTVTVCLYSDLAYHQARQTFNTF